MQHILMVIPDQRNYEAISQALNQADQSSQFTWTPSGEEALARLQAGPFDLALLETDLETLQQIRQNFSGPLVFLAQTVQMAVNALEVGARDYLIKDPAGEYLTLLPTVIQKAWQQEQIIQNEEKYRQLFEAESDAIFLIDNKTGRILEANLAATTLYGYTHTELLEKKNTDLSAEPSQTRRATVESWQHVPVRYHRKQDGTVFPVEITAHHLSWRGHPAHIAAIRDITARQRAEETLYQRSLEQETVSLIARALNTLNLREAFPTVAENVKKLTRCDRVSMALLEEDDYFRMIILDSPGPVLEQGTRMPMAATASAADLRAGRFHLTPDLSAELDFPGEQMLYEAGFRSRINLPLLVGDRVIGALNLASYQLHLFQEEDIPVLQQIANTLAVAIENSRLFGIEQQQRQEADTLRAAALALTTALHQDEVIERILAQLQQVVPYDTCSVQLLRTAWGSSQEPDRLEIVGGRGFPNLSDLLGFLFILGEDNPNTDVVRSRKPVIVPDAPVKYENFLYEPHAKSHIHSWLGVPMLVGNRLAGMIALDKREPSFYTQEHARLAEAFAAQAAIAVENAQLYEAERKRAKQLATVSQVARKATSILNSKQLLQEIVTAIQQGFGYFNVVLLEFNETTEELDHQAIAGGFKSIARPNYSQPVGVGLIGQAAQTGQSLLVNNVGQDTRYITGFVEEVPTQSELCVPIKIEKRVIGVLDVQEPRTNAFDETDVMALEILADQMAVSIENARLYEQAHQNAQAKTVLLDEVNHRVKNNLTGIIGLLYAARNRAKVENQATYQTTMNDLIGRVRGLASVHDMLSESEWTPLHLSSLAEEIISVTLRTLPRDKHVTLNVPASPVRVTSDQAHNLALVINELATNAIKYALGEREAVCITCRISQNSTTACCEFRDDGPGYPDKVLHLERHNVGFDLIQNIVRHNLRGKLSLSNDQGAVAVIQFETEV